MVTVLLIYMLVADEHHASNVPKFYAVYRNDISCQSAAEKYMALSGQVNILINTRCVDARNPALVPLLHNVIELESVDENKI